MLPSDAKGYPEAKELSCPTTRHEGTWRYSSYSFLKSALDGMSGQSHVPASLYSRETTPGTHYTEGWVGFRVGLETEAIEKILSPLRGSNLNRPVVQSVARHYTDRANPKRRAYSYKFIVEKPKINVSSPTFRPDATNT
jgi:hypothetical protein